MRGPKPKPAAVHKLHGTFRSDRHGAALEVEAGVPSCPDFLGPVARQVWAELAPQLVSMGVLSALDQGVFAGFCQAVAEFRWATETLERDGRTQTLGSGKAVPHPAVAMQRSAMKALVQLGSSLGLDPASRTRLHVEAPRPTDPKKAKYFRAGVAARDRFPSFNGDDEPNDIDRIAL